MKYKRARKKNYRGDHYRTNVWGFEATIRQVEVAQLICTGMSNKEIAAQLDLHIKTVKSHITELFKSAEVNSRTKLILKIMHFRDKGRKYETVRG